MCGYLCVDDFALRLREVLQHVVQEHAATVGRRPHALAPHPRPGPQPPEACGELVVGDTVRVRRTADPNRLDHARATELPKRHVKWKMK